jgi:hypothetical protein
MNMLITLHQSESDRQQCDAMTAAPQQLHVTSFKPSFLLTNQHRFQQVDGLQRHPQKRLSRPSSIYTKIHALLYVRVAAAH